MSFSPAIVHHIANNIVGVILALAVIAEQVARHCSKSELMRIADDRI